MKQIVFLLLSTFLFSFSHAQTIAELQNAIRSGNKAVQAIHGYPNAVYEGKCHWVPVTDINLSGNQLKIIETWTSPYGTATTVLTGSVVQNRVSGNWSSGFSSGTWSYNFITNTGQWNKTKSMAQTFDDMYSLKFRIVLKKDIKDGPYYCN